MPAEKMPQHPHLRPLRPSRPSSNPEPIQQQRSDLAASNQVLSRVAMNEHNVLPAFSHPATPNSDISLASSNSATVSMFHPPSNQREPIAHTLRTEIESHNQTRNALHNKMQLRNKAVQRLLQLSLENNAWTIAYNDSMATL